MEKWAKQETGNTQVANVFASFSVDLIFNPEDRSDNFLRNVGRVLLNYKALESRKS
jgi:hypothetical protein